LQDAGRLIFSDMRFKYGIIVLIFLCISPESNPTVIARLGNGTFCYLGSLTIEGSTTISSIELIYSNKYFNDTDSFYEKYNSEGFGDEVIFKIPILDIQGENKKIVSDFQALLKFNEFQSVEVKIKKDVFIKMIEPAIQQQLIFDLSVAGVSKQTEAKYTTHVFDENHKLIRGKASVKLSDFSLKPPARLLGLVKVHDEIFITFEIIIVNKPAITKTQTIEI